MNEHHDDYKLNSLKKKAENARDAKAQYELGSYYSTLPGAENAKKAVEQFRKAAKLWLTEAAFVLGGCYEMGFGVKKNGKSALRWYKTADECVTADVMRGPDPIGQIENAILEMYMTNETFQKITDESLEFYHDDRYDDVESLRAAAEIGDAKAQSILGHHYYYGNEVEKDVEAALELFKLAADQDYEAAHFHLAQHYESTGDLLKAAACMRNYVRKRIEWRNSRLGRIQG